MRTLPTVIALVAVLAFTAPNRAQSIRIEQSVSGEMTQLPESGREVKTGTGVIQGRVYALDTSQPIRRAQVRISGSDILPKAALTDVEGRFEFRDLPAGRFTLQASKSGYVAVQFGQTRPYESGRPIELVDKQVMDTADIAMPRGSVIAGRIVDEFGEPMPDVSVTALRQTWRDGRRRLVPAPGRVAMTNDLGQFRIYGLPPGDYYVSASLRSGPMELVTMLETARVMAGSTAAGPSASAPSSGYAPTYFPGTPNPSEAQKITLLVGQENHSADFALMPVRLARITGIVIGSDGKPMAGAAVSVTPGDRTATTLLSHMSTARTDQNGAFTLNGVAPGDYTLHASTLHVTTMHDDGAARRVFAVRAFAAGQGDDAESGSLPVTVAGEDITNIVLGTAKGGTAKGQVRFEGGVAPQHLGALRILAMPADSGVPTVSFGGGVGRVEPDGAFELKGPAGPRLIRPTSLPAGWTLKSVRLNGLNITDTGAEFTPGAEVTGLEVILSNRTTSVTGGATASDGSPIKGYTVVIFSDDEERWLAPRTRWVTGARPDQEGRFRVRDLPPGTYHAVAVEYVAQGEWSDPELLARLKDKGERFTLDDGGTQVLDLKIVGAY